MVSSCRFIAALRLYHWLVAQNYKMRLPPQDYRWSVVLFILSPILCRGRCAGVRSGHCWALSGCSGSGSNGFAQPGMQSWESWKLRTTPQHVLQEKEASFVKWSGVCFGRHQKNGVANVVSAGQWRTSAGCEEPLGSYSVRSV